MTNRFEGRVAVVTGAAGGIGSAACRRFAAEGARVVAVDLGTADLGAAVSIIEGAGSEGFSIEADVTDESQVAAYVAAVEERYGRIDVLFNNAGIEGPVSPTVDYPEPAFDAVMGVNVKGVFFGMKHTAASMMRTGGGSIINTASVAGLCGTPMVIAYGASKHAVVGMTKTAAREWGPVGIRTNAVCPSPIDTRMWDALVEGLGGDDADEFRKQSEQRVPLGRIGAPDEVVALVTFLASDDASFINGAIYPVDGGSRAA